MVVSLDMSRMNKVVWVDKDNMIACVQAGIRGQIIWDSLRDEGEPEEYGDEEGAEEE